MSEISNQTKVLNALVEKETTYHIDVDNNSMLPENKKEEREISFTIKPPSLATLALCATYFESIPKELLNPEKQITLQEITPYLDNLVKYICTLAHCGDNYPQWHEAFIKKNATPRDIFKICHETAMFKMGIDFFLNSFQIASQNPMMMKRPRRGLTPFS